MWQNRWGKTVLNFCMVKLVFRGNKLQNYWNLKYIETLFGFKRCIGPFKGRWLGHRMLPVGRYVI